MDPVIKDTRYEETFEVEEETALGKTVTRKIKIDQIIVSVDVGLGKDHQMAFTPEAVANRMAGYNLATEGEAVEALVREHIFRMDPDLQPDDPDDPVQANGGVDERIKVKWKDNTSKDKCKAVLDSHAERIEQAYEVFSSKEPEIITELEQMEKDAVILEPSNVVPISDVLPIEGQ